MGTIRKRGIRYRAEICVNGKRESKTLDTKRQAQKWILLRETSLEKDPRQICAISLFDVMDRYADEVTPKKKSPEKELLRIRALQQNPFAQLSILDIKTEHIAKWRDLRLKQVSPSSVARELNLWSHIFNVARKEWDYIDRNPVSDVTRPREAPPRDRRITEDEIERICMALGFDDQSWKPKRISQRVAVAFLLAIETAMRVKELCGLKPADISGNVAFLRDTKTTPRKVPLSREAVRLLSLVSNDLDLEPMQITSNFRKAVKCCMIDDLHFHDSRHEAITRLARKLDVLDLARMVGHKNIQQLMTYYNASPEDIAARLDQD